MNSKKVVWSITKLVGFGGTIGGVLYLAQKALKKESDFHNRYKSYYTTANQWLINKNEGKNVAEYFKENNYKTIAIYGMGTMGELFYDELKNSSNVKVAYFIDKNAEDLYYGVDDLPVVGLDDISSQQKIDAIIVTPIYDFDKIEEDLEDAGVDTNIVSLEDIIYEI